MALSAKTSRNIKACTCNACGACRPAAGSKRARVVKVSAASYHSNWRSTPTASKHNYHLKQQQAMPRRLPMPFTMQILPRASAKYASTVYSAPHAPPHFLLFSLPPAVLCCFLPVAAILPLSCLWSICCCCHLSQSSLCFQLPVLQPMAAPLWPPAQGAPGSCSKQSALCPQSQLAGPHPTPSTAGKRHSRWYCMCHIIWGASKSTSGVYVQPNAAASLLPLLTHSTAVKTTQ